MNTAKEQKLKQEIEKLLSDLKERENVLKQDYKREALINRKGELNLFILRVQQILLPYLGTKAQ
jgi:hypothetical protein